MKLENVTDVGEPSPRRRYEDACGAAHALDLVGERWALLVMRELMFGPKRFSDLRGGLPGISANVLAQRLSSLEESSVVARRRLPPPAASQVYELTEWGRESEPIFQALGRWAARSPRHDPTLPFSAASLMLSLRTMLDARAAAGLDVRIGFRLGAEAFMARIADGAVTIAAGETEAADLVLDGRPSVMAALIYGGAPPAALEAEGALRIDGDRALLARLPDLFPLPAKAGATGGA